MRYTIFLILLLLVACSTGDATKVVNDFSNTAQDSNEQALDYDGKTGPKSNSPQTLQIPLQSEWVDKGIIFSSGVDGEWDNFLWGGFATSAIKYNGEYLLYYQGANEYIDDPHYTVANRFIGIARSTDGINFEKYEQNPVLVYSPNNHFEEGAASGGFFVDNNMVYAYFGANELLDASSPDSQVNADGKLAQSNDGYNFLITQTVLDHDDSSIWGYGDELFPIIGFKEGSTYYSYYLPNGASTPARTVGVAWGDSIANLQNSAGVFANGRNVHGWGPAGYAKITDKQYAIFISALGTDGHSTARHLDVYLVNLDNPNVFEGPIHSYEFSDYVAATVMFDKENNRWLMYYRNAGSEAYGVKEATAKYQ